MPIDEFDDFDAPPQKWLDKRRYTRVDPVTGLPQLIRVEPIVTKAGEFIPSSVTVYIDDAMMVMEREAAEILIDSMNCIPLEMVAQGWKHKKIN